MRRRRETAAPAAAGCGRPFAVLSHAHPPGAGAEDCAAAAAARKCITSSKSVSLSWRALFFSLDFFFSATFSALLRHRRSFFRRSLSSFNFWMWSRSWFPTTRGAATAVPFSPGAAPAAAVAWEPLALVVEALGPERVSADREPERLRGGVPAADAAGLASAMAGPGADSMPARTGQRSDSLWGGLWARNRSRCSGRRAQMLGSVSLRVVNLPGSRRCGTFLRSGFECDQETPTGNL